MANRTTQFLCIFFASLVLCSGASHARSRFQVSFLPPTAVPASEVTDRPEVQPNQYLPAASAADRPAPAQLTSKTVELVNQAERHFQRGKKYYQVKDISSARKEFDAAVDRMLEAGGNEKADLQTYEKRLEEMIEAVHRYDLSGLGSAVPVVEAEFEKAPLEDILEMTFPSDPRLKSKVLAQIQATASQLPLSVNDAVVSYIHYFSGRGRKTLIAGLQRAGRYHPMIQRILDEEGLPQELIHLAQAESGFLPRARSRKAAVGMWQFVAWRGHEYSLMQSRYTDDRLDPERATRAAARHLRDLYHQFGDWYLAVAAYNCGPGTVQKAVERTGYADFWELRRLRVLPLETTNYVPIILAMTIMSKNASEYGLLEVTPDAALQYDTVEITASTHLALVGDLTDTPVSQLMELNPALLKTSIPEGYALRVPKATARPLIAALQLIPEERRASWRMHKVERGETLAEIGKLYGTTPSRIVAANQLVTESPVAGDRLVIPAVALERNIAAKSMAYGRSSTRASRASATNGAARSKKQSGASKVPAVFTRTAATHRSQVSQRN